MASINQITCECAQTFDDFKIYNVHLFSHFKNGKCENASGYSCPFPNKSGLTCTSKPMMYMRNLRTHLRNYHSHCLDYDEQTREFSFNLNLTPVQVAVNRIEVFY